MPDEGRIYTEDGAAGFAKGSFIFLFFCLSLMKQFILPSQNEVDVF